MAKFRAPHILEIPPFPKGADDYVVHAIIETPRNIRHKYAVEPKYGLFRLKQTIPEGLEWPYDYGFVPGTLAKDGDPTDIVVLNDSPTFTGCLVTARLIGIVNLRKNGIENDRLVACPLRLKGVAQSTDGFDTIHDLPKDTVKSLCRFLVDYSEEEGNKIAFDGVQSRKKALKALLKTVKTFERS
jgi:inorganic pyrophosphatase